jgi:hypothetical protein
MRTAGAVIGPYGKQKACLKKNSSSRAFFNLNVKK